MCEIKRTKVYFVLLQFTCLVAVSSGLSTGRRGNEEKENKNENLSVVIGSIENFIARSARLGAGCEQILDIAAKIPLYIVLPAILIIPFIIYLLIGFKVSFIPSATAPIFERIRDKFTDTGSGNGWQRKISSNTQDPLAIPIKLMSDKILTYIQNFSDKYNFDTKQG